MDAKYAGKLLESVWVVDFSFMYPALGPEDFSHAWDGPNPVAPLVQRLMNLRRDSGSDIPEGLCFKLLANSVIGQLQTDFSVAGMAGFCYAQACSGVIS